MISIWNLNNGADATAFEARLKRLRLDPADLALSRGELAGKEASVRRTITDVASRGDDAIVEHARRYDDPNFTINHIRVAPEETAAAAARIRPDLSAALRQAIEQIQHYQNAMMPRDPQDCAREGVQLGMRFTPVDSAGCYFPGGKAAYPSSLIHLAVPAMVAGVKTVVVCTPPSKHGKSDAVLAACHELKLEHVYRAGGAAAIAALAFGTKTIPAVEKIVGPGNDYVQLAKRAVSGGVGIDGYLGPSEVLVIADETANPEFIAADLLAQAEHDPGSCFLLTNSQSLSAAVVEQVAGQLPCGRRAAIEKSLANDSAIILADSIDALTQAANRIAAEHVNLQCRDNDAILKNLRHAGAIFIGPWSAVAAGDYVAGPSHCLPTNTTARFSSGVSVYEFLKRSSIVRYESRGLLHDAGAVIALAQEEGLDAHAASIGMRRTSQ